MRKAEKPRRNFYKQHGSEEAKDRTADILYLIRMVEEEGKEDPEMGWKEHWSWKEKTYPGLQTTIASAWFPPLCRALASGLSPVFFPVSSLTVAPTNPVTHVLALLSLRTTHDPSKIPKASHRLL